VMPAFILAAVIVAIAGAGTLRIILVIALLSWPQAARLMRGQVLKVKQYEYVDAVRCLGIPEWKILLREVIPNAVGPLIALTPLIAGQAILIEAALGFLGLSSPDVVTWGAMLNDGQQLLFEAWWLSVFPGAAILITVIAFNLIGDALNDVLSPRRSS
jgi:peptide/nickel transport system permease protein